MASRVNTRLVLIVILAFGAMAGLVGGLYVMRLRGDATRNLRKGEEAWARQDYEAAADQFARALNKDPGNPEYLRRAEEALLKLVPANPIQARELYQQRLGMLSHAVLHNSSNAQAHLRLLAELHASARRLNTSRDWESVVQAADNMALQVPADDPLRPYAQIYKAMAMSRLTGIRPETEVSQALSDLDTALFVIPDSDLGWSTKILSQLAAINRMESSGRPRSTIVSAREELNKSAARAIEQAPNGPETARANLIRLLDQRRVTRGANEQLEHEITDQANRLVAILASPVDNPPGTPGAPASPSPASADVAGCVQDAVNILQLVSMPVVEQTIDLMRRTIAAHPDAIDIQVLLANTCLRKGDLAAAEQEAEQILAAPQATVSLNSLLQYAWRTEAANVLSDIAYRRWESAPADQKAALLEKAAAAATRLGEVAGGDDTNGLVLRSKARLALARQQYAEAAQSLEQLVRLTNESDVESLVFAATALDRVGQPGLAYERISRAVTLSPENGALIVERANMELRLGRTEDAKRTFDSLSEADRATPRAQQVAAAIQRAVGGAGPLPSDPIEAALQRANEALIKGDAENARAAVIGDLAANPDNVRLLEAAAVIELRSGQREKAREYVDRVLKINPQSPGAMQMDIVLRFDDPLQATLEYIKATVPEGEPRVAATLASAVSMMGQQREQARALTAAGKAEEAAKATAIADRASAEADRAAAELEKIDPENAALIDFRLGAAVQAKDWTAAEQLVLKARDLNLDSCQGLFYKGRLEAARGDYRAAAATLEQATQKISFSAQIWSVLANVYQQLGNFAQSERAFEQAYRCNPNDMAVARAYIGVLQRRGDKTRALQILQSAHRLAPQDRMLRETWLTLEGEVGDKVAALTERQRLYAADPADRDNAIALALMLSQLEPSRILVLDADGQPVYSQERWDSLSGADRERIVGQARAKWRADSDAMIQSLAAAEGDELRVAVLRAYVMKERGDVAAGETILRDFVSKHDKSTQTEDMYVELGRYQAGISHYTDAIESVKAAVALNGPKKREALLNLAMLQMQLNQYADALPNLQAALDLLDDQGVRLQIVECLTNLGRMDDAEKQLNESTAGVGGSVGTLLAAKIADGRADAAITAGKLDEADRFVAQQRDLLSKAETQDPTNPLPRLLLAQSLLKEYDRTRRQALLEDALQELDRVDRIRAGLNESASLRVLALKAKGDNNGAVAQLRRMVEANPDNMTARSDLIAMLMNAKDQRAAAAEIEAAIRDNPTVAVWYEMRGDLNRNGGDANQASLDYAKAYDIMPVSGLLSKLAAALMAKQPPDCRAAADRLAAGVDRGDEPGLRELYAKALNCLGQRDQAIAQLRLAFASRRKSGQTGAAAPEDILPWFLAVSSVYPPEQTAEAERVVMELSENQPTVLELRDLGRLWAREPASGLSRAIELQRQAVTLCPAEDDAARAALNRILGDYLIRAGDMRGASEVYDVLVRLQPTNLDALNNLAFIRADALNDAAGAVPLAERLLNLAAQNPSVLDTVGWVYFKSGDLERAKQHLNASLAILPSADTYVHLASVLAHAGDRAGAEKQLLEAEKLNPGADAQQKIKSLRDDINKGG